MQPVQNLNDNAEKELIQLLVVGDSAAFETLFNKYYKSIFILASKYLKDDSLAEDAVQEVFCKLWLNRSSLNPDYPVKAFLFTIAKNHILNVLRNNAKAADKILEYVSRNTIQSIDGDESLKLSETTQILDKTINSLPKKRRIIVKLKLYKGLDNAEIAQKLHISVNTVKFQYYLALKVIKEALLVFIATSLEMQ